MGPLIPTRILTMFILLSTTVVGYTQSDNQAVILQYHHVSTDSPPVTSLSKESFTAHMDYLDENGFTILPLEAVLHRLKNGPLLPDKTAVITFDDGYTSVYEVAYPLLQEKGWPFTVFVTTGLVGTNDSLYSTWEEIQIMASNGATIANHTVSHPYLLEHPDGQSEQQWLEGVRNEILQAEATILEKTGQGHKIVAYPYGEYNPAIQQLVSELGFTGIGQHSGPVNATSDFTALPRFPFSGIYASMNSFPTKVMSLAFSLDEVLSVTPVTRESSPTAELDFVADQAGLRGLSCFNNNERIEIDVLNNAENRYKVSTHINNRSRRFRYNCTAPGQEGRYFWYSIPWVNPDIPE